MNINSAIPYYIPAQTPRQTLAPLPTNPPSSDVSTHQEKKEAYAKEFYTREEEPWNKISYDYMQDGVPVSMQHYAKECYLLSMRVSAARELGNQELFFGAFKKQVAHIRPDLAEKNFSFTLGDDAEIKILDPGKKLNDDDLQWLTRAINSDGDFKGSVREGAKLIMTIFDHDSKNFSGKTNLNLLNFQDIVDLGKVLSDPIDMTEGWMKQVKEHDEKNGNSLINTYA